MYCYFVYLKLFKYQSKCCIHGGYMWLHHSINWPRLPKSIPFVALVTEVTTTCDTTAGAHCGVLNDKHMILEESAEKKNLCLIYEIYGL